jgi:3-oxoacyl-[acyl-carrier protein] reductase
MARLANRIALVTGSSRGIGAAIAKRLAADGAKVILHASAKRDQAEVVAKYIRSKGGIADIVIGDLSTRGPPRQIVRDAFAFHGALDILVNNAAVSKYCPIGDVTAEAMDEEISVNLCAMILATSEFAKLTTSTCGRVINISSGAGRHPAYGRSVYSATKGGMEAFSRSIAQELGERGITVNAVAPGTTVTELFEAAERQQKNNWRELFARWAAMRRVGQPEDIADIVAFVACDDARWLTGNTLAADGGLVTTGTNITTYTK